MSNGDCSASRDRCPYLKKLVTIRQEYKDALIYGAQSYQPSADGQDVAAYFYKGSTHRVITVVNTLAEQRYDGSLTVRKSEANSAWRDVLTDHVFRGSGVRLQLKIPPHELRILVRESFN